MPLNYRAEVLDCQARPVTMSPPLRRGDAIRSPGLNHNSRRQPGGFGTWIAEPQAGDVSRDCRSAHLTARSTAAFFRFTQRAAMPARGMR